MSWVAPQADLMAIKGPLAAFQSVRAVRRVVSDQSLRYLSQHCSAID